MMKLFELYNGDIHRYPIVVSIPHSGTHVPNDIRGAMLCDALLPNMDWFLPELFSFFKEMKVTVLTSNISRYVVDLNRDKEEDLNGEDFWTRLVYTHNTFDKPIYQQEPSAEEIETRILKYYDPYHYALETLLRAKLMAHKKVWLLDLHSFSIDFEEGADEDICLSNYDGWSSSTASIAQLGTLLGKEGYRIAYNTVRGRYILRRYKSLFEERIEAIQMELRYTKYIEDRFFGEEELTGWNNELFDSAQQKLKHAFATLLKELHGGNNEL